MGNRRELANGKKIWVIKAGFPDNPTKIQWSDYVFANTMKKYLERIGYYVVVESKDEWYNEEEADVVVSLRGPFAYCPDSRKEDCTYILWNLSHPDTVTDEEYNAFDLVCIGSEKEEYLEKIRARVQVPVVSLPMCVDTELFYPEENPVKEKAHEWVFVGNSRGKERKSVLWAIRHGLPLEIWGAGWKKFIPDEADYEKYVVAENLPNHELRTLYWNSMATFDDHYEDMIQNGFINTRIMEAVACGLPVISDYSEVLTSMFGDGILCYHNEEEFLQLTERVKNEYPMIKEKTLALWPIIQNRYSFESCMNQLSEWSEKIICREKDSQKKMKYLQREILRLREEKQTLSEDLKKMEADLENEKKRREDYQVKCQNAWEQNRKTNEKLQRTYAEKSEINRKLQITYGEKYDRGLEIKKLKKEIESIKKSRTYRLARVFGAPVRFLRKLFKKTSKIENKGENIGQ